MDYNDYNSLDKYMRGINKLKLLSSIEEKEILVIFSKNHHHILSFLLLNYCDLFRQILTHQRNIDVIENFIQSIVAVENTNKKDEKINLLVKETIEKFSNLCVGENLYTSISENLSFLQDCIAIEDINKMVNQNNAIQKKIIANNIRLVIAFVKNKTGVGGNFMDCIQDGIINIIRALENFDVDRNVNFSTYVNWWQKDSLSKSRSKLRMIYLPRSMMKQLREIAATEEELKKRLGKQPTIEAIATELKISVAKVNALSEMAYQPLSFSEMTKDGNNGDDFVNFNTNHHTDVNYKFFLKDAVKKSMSFLDERERIIIIKRFGLDGEDTATYDEIGKATGYSSERIRQLESKIIAKLRRCSFF